MNKKELCELLCELSLYFYRNPHIRFGQALWNLGILQGTPETIKDPFYDSDKDILERVKKALKDA